MTRRNRDREREAEAILGGDWSAVVDAAVAKADLRPGLMAEARMAAEGASSDVRKLFTLALAYAGKDAHILAGEAANSARRWASRKSVRLTRKERDKFETVRRKLVDLADGKTQASDHAVEALKHIDQALFSIFFDEQFGLPESRQREYAVRDVTRCWCRHTGQAATATYDQTSNDPSVKWGDLHQTPLVQFVGCALRTYFPGLDSGDIYRGIKLAEDTKKRAEK